MLGPETIPLSSYLGRQLREEMGHGSTCFTLKVTPDRLVSLHHVIQSEKQRIYLRRVGGGEMDVGASAFVFDIYSSQHLTQDLAVDVRGD